MSKSTCQSKQKQQKQHSKKGEGTEGFVVMGESVQPVVLYFPQNKTKHTEALDPSHDLFCGLSVVVIVDEGRNVGTFTIL